MLTRAERRKRKAAPQHDLAAELEANAIRLLSSRSASLRRNVSSSVPWSPKKPGGSYGWLRLSENRRLRAIMVRGRSVTTPKLRATYERMFG